MNFESAIVEAMNVQDLHDYVNSKSTEELQTLIDIANKRINKLNEEKEAYYMDGIQKAIQAYLDNVGDLTFRVEYEDADGCDAETEISVDSSNPPACGQGYIFI